jgi:hypothetical protein
MKNIIKILPLLLLISINSYAFNSFPAPPNRYEEQNHLNDFPSPPSIYQEQERANTLLNGENQQENQQMIMQGYPQNSNPVYIQQYNNMIIPQQENEQNSNEQDDD